MESRKDYNKKYYAANKTKICAQLFEKEKCLLCDKLISHQNMKKHMTSKLCKSRATRQQPNIDITAELESIKNNNNDPLMYCWGCNESLVTCNESCNLNKVKYLEKVKEYYDLNIEKINEQRNEKNECSCGGQYTKCNKLQHFKTSKHKNYINNL